MPPHEPKKPKPTTKADQLRALREARYEQPPQTPVENPKPKPVKRKKGES